MPKTTDSVFLDDLERMQGWDFSQKKVTSLLQIQAWIDHWSMLGQSVYVCLDSPVEGPLRDAERVLLDLCRTVLPDIQVASARSFSNVTARHIMEDSARMRPFLPGICYGNPVLTATWMQESCADTEAPHPSSRPTSFWMPSDIQTYVTTILREKGTDLNEMGF